MSKISFKDNLFKCVQVNYLFKLTNIIELKSRSFTKLSDVYMFICDFNIKQHLVTLLVVCINSSSRK